MSEVNFERSAYEIDEIWNKDWFDKENELRIKKIASIVDKNIESIADIGCGNGMFLDEILELKKNNYFKRLSKICGVDRSLAALKKVSGDVESMQGSIDKLVYEDNSFDCVTCLEVIEHLPNSIYENALNELSRIAGKTIIIAVPYKEDIKNSLITCNSCNTKFNADFHMRSFDEEKLKFIFDKKNITLTEFFYIGRTVNYFSIGRKILSFFKKFPSHAICPVCGYHEHHKLRNISKNKKNVSGLKAFAKLYFKRILPGKPTWIVAIYEKS